jgi:antirestriction protein ArdC
MSVYEIVTSEIIKKLEKGTIPWRQPWTSKGQAVSWYTQKPYRGINALLLDPGEYATFNQIQAVGGKVKKGSKGHLVVFWKLQHVEEVNQAGEKVSKTVPLLRYYKVFEINSQCEGISSKRNEETFDHDPIVEAERIAEGYPNKPEINFAPGRAFYRPSTDLISVPPLNDYPKAEDYYATLFHEMIHSTGHSSRLNRLTTEAAAAFGSESYSKEELIAEIGSAMLCGKAGIVQATIDNSAAYCQSWIRRLQQDSRLIVMSSSQAQKAADHILGVTNDD